MSNMPTPTPLRRRLLENLKVDFQEINDFDKQVKTPPADDFAKLQNPERILRIGEQQGVVMRKVCDSVAKQFAEMIEDAKKCVAELETHKKELRDQIETMLNEHVAEGHSHVQKLEAEAGRIASWIEAEAKSFAEHATAVANKLSMMQGKVTSAQPTSLEKVTEGGNFNITVE